MIQINLNKQLDQETFLNFFDLKIGGVDFGAGIKKEYPLISKENYKEYIDDYYKEHQQELNKSLRDIRNKVSEVEKDFFEGVKNIFGEDFRRNNYYGALSIFNCNPRYLDKGIFQVYYKKDILDKLEVVLHETLHFIFFEYCDNNLKNAVADLDKDSGPYWALSEIFNVVVLNLPEFQKILQRPEHMFYPDLKNHYYQIKDIWEEEGGGINKFLEDSLYVLRKEYGS